MFKNSSLMGLRYIAPAALALTALGCSGTDTLTDCSVSAELDALEASVSELGKVAAEFETQLTTACTAIVEADGGSATGDVEAICASAAATIDAAFSANASAYIEITPGYCTIDASAQFGCEAGCEVSGECDFSPGAIEARCTPGEFSVSCEGSCEGSAYCEAEANVSVACEGSCQGSCEGSCTVELTAAAVCDGNCTGECNGSTSDGAACAGECKGTCELTGSAAASCSGSCEGSCSGRCEIAADASVTCDAEVRCEGSCDGTASLPECDVDIKPPEASCDIDAECQANCEASASLDAECVAPTITISAQAEISADLRIALEAQLPVILEIGANTEVLLSAAANVPVAFKNAATAALDFPGCIANYGASFVTQAEATVDISISIEASASASGSVAGSTS